MTDYDGYEYLIWAEHEARKRMNPQWIDNDNPGYIETAQEAFWAEDDSCER